MQDFLNYWGVSKPIFREMDGDQGIFVPPSFEKTLHRLTLACENEQPFVCITSAGGHGKTTLGRWLHQRLAPQQFESFYLTLLKSEAEAGWLWKKLALYFGDDSPNSSTETEMATVTRGIDELAEENRRLVIFIDEAHKLTTAASFEDIHTLISVQGISPVSIGFVLLGTAEMLKKVTSVESLRHRLSLKAEIPLLNSKETGAYLRFRLNQAGLPEDTLTDSAIEMIHRHSRGVYSMINAIADNAFMEAFINGRKTVDSDIVRAAWDFMPQNGQRSYQEAQTNSVAVKEFAAGDSTASKLRVAAPPVTPPFTEQSQKVPPITEVPRPGSSMAKLFATPRKEPQHEPQNAKTIPPAKPKEPAQQQNEASAKQQESAVKPKPVEKEVASKKAEPQKKPATADQKPAEEQNDEKIQLSSLFYRHKAK